MQRLDDVAAIETPEQVELELRLAGLGTRTIAYVVDFLVQLVFIIVVGIVLFTALHLSASLGESRSPGQVPLAFLAAFSLATFAVNTLYFIACELLWNGRSVGKRAFGLRVVLDTGHPIDGRASLIRNVVRLVDMLPALYTVGIVALFLEPKHRRLGDLAAGTLVVREDRIVPATHLEVRRRFVGWLSPAEAELVDDFLDRREQLVALARTNVAANLAGSIARAHGMEVTVEPERFLEELAT